MRKLFKYYLFFLAFVILTCACSKEKKIERWLKKGVGEWQVKTVNYKFYENDTLKTDDTDNIISEKYVFDENGNFFISRYFDADQTIMTSNDGGSWTNSKDVISLKHTNGLINELKILEIDKKKMKLEEVTEYPNSEKYVNTLWLEKED